MSPVNRPLPTRSLIGWIPLGFLMALGLHALVLFMPLSSSEEVPVPDPAEQETISISRVPLKAEESQTEEPASGPQSASVRSAQPRPALTPQRPPQASSRSVRSSAQTNRSGSSSARQPSRRQTANETDSRRSAAAEIAALPPDSTTAVTSPAEQPRSPQPSEPAAPDKAQGLTTLLAYAKTLAAKPMIASDALVSYINYLRRAYAYNPADTTAAEATQNLNQWLNDMASAIPADMTQPIESEVALAYPLKVCLEQVPQTANVGAVVTTSGSLAADPVLLQSTGYEGLNEKAIALVKEQPFDPENSPQAYLYQVTVEYDRDRCFQPPDSAETAAR
ncbi:hypothetical protein [Sphaerothrix gracilis]|uniref:hypothetical protein n=1 Tax=Sphaerothrix gracilis TaxID=3151835 RepID=UPI0031FC0B23